MASEFSTNAGHKVARLLKYHEGPPYNIPEILDAELQGMREVLSEVIREHDDPMSEYGCTTHTCQRARAERLTALIDKSQTCVVCEATLCEPENSTALRELHSW
jgi:hypothetical protein